MSVFRVEKNKGYTVMSNHHLRNHKVRKQMGYFFAHKKPARQNHAGFELKEHPISA